MALRFGLSGLAALVGLAIVSGCASEDSNTGLGNPDGGAGKAGFGGAIGGAGGGKTGGAGGVNFGGTGNGGSPVGGAGGVGGSPTGGAAGVGGSPTGGAGGGGGTTGGAGGGGGAGGTTSQDSCAGWCGNTDPAPGPAQCFCDTSCLNWGDCCSDYATHCGSGGTGGSGGSGGSTGGAGGSGGSTGGSGGGGSNSCVGSCGVQASGGCWCDEFCESNGDCCSDKVAVCGSSSGGGGAGGATGGGGSGGSTGGSGGSTGGSGGSTGGSGGSTGGSGGTGGATGGTGGTGGSTGGCDEAEDCSNPSTMVCDPDTLTCGAGQCTGTQACPTGQICLGQVASPVVGACYKSCTPFATSTGCSSTQECAAIQLDLADGACFAKGTKTEGQACTDNDVSTGCTTGNFCVRDVGTNVCRKLCNYFASSPSCLLNQRCVVGGVCSAENGDSAALNQACSVASAAGEICGNDGKAWRGTCQDVFGTGTLTCLKVCRTSVAADCPSGTLCEPFQGDNTAGVCF